MFNSLQQPNTLAWNLIMKSHVDSGLFTEALFLYTKMKELGVRHDSFTFPIINRAVSSLKSDVVVGEMVFCDAIKLGFGFDLYFCNTMIDFYVKSGCVSDARKLFDEMPHRDLVSYTSLIAGFASEGDVAGTFELYNKMRLEMEPNSVTFIVMLRGCSSGCGNLNEGRQLHGCLIKDGLLLDVSVLNSVLKMYCKMGCAKEVETCFIEIGKKDIVSWNTLISFYSLIGDVEKVASCLSQMLSELIFSSETLTLVTSMFANMGNLLEGEKLHCIAIKLGLCDDILLTSFLDLYAKCGALRNSTQLFREMSCRSSITWNTMMSGFVRNGNFGEAIGLFRQMQAAGLKLGAEFIVVLIDACTYLGALQLGKEIHGYLIRNLFRISEEDGLRLRTSILNMYARCGSISSARKCFHRMPIKDIVAWTAMIESYGMHGLGVEALNLFHQMLKEGITPNGATFLSLLSSCSHSGLVSEGIETFVSIRSFGIQPELDHYTCMVDLLGRRGKLKEALSLIVKMVICADSRIWGALLAGCRVHGDKKVGDFAAQRVLELEPDNVGYYTLLSNVEAGVENWGEVEEVRRIMQEKELKKTPGWSYIEGKEGNSCFVSGDRSHKLSGEIYQLLGSLNRKVQELGFT